MLARFGMDMLDVRTWKSQRSLPCIRRHDSSTPASARADSRSACPSCLWEGWTDGKEAQRSA